MRRFFTNLLRAVPKSVRRPHLNARLGVERFEQRDVPASLGLKTAILDFDGESITAGQMAQGGWGGEPATTVSSFMGRFVAGAPLSVFDFNGNGVVNVADANIAMAQILAKVRQDFAPYQVQIVFADFDNHVSRLNDAMVGDAFVMITGGANTVSQGSSAGIFGVAPKVDAGNIDDDIAFVFGGNIINASASKADLVNRVARTISHELGHTFGLDHITVTAGDAVSHHLMNAPNNGIDPRDFSRDFVFMDQAFATDSGLQNAHNILNSPTVLGPSANAWIAVLNPGRLTVSGTDLANAIGITSNAANTIWTVSGAGATQSITRQSLSLTSLNPFDAQLTEVRVMGRGGNDTIAANFSFLGRLIADGGAGNDTITGGAGDDVLRGSIGNDVINGGGGADQLLGDDGNDTLRGGIGNDTLLGGDGRDALFGDAGDDRLDGGDEGLFGSRDTLTGGAGLDTFFQHRSLFLFDQDLITDRVNGEPVVNS